MAAGMQCPSRSAGLGRSNAQTTMPLHAAIALPRRPALHVGPNCADLSSTRSPCQLLQGHTLRHSKRRVVSLQAAVADPTPQTRIRRIQDVDNGLILGFGADLSEDHPGFHDEAYKRRRADIAAAARNHKIGEPIPDIDYTPEERQTWALALKELRGQLPQHACKEFLRAWPLFNFREDKVPQLQEVSDVLQATTGWRIRPVAGLMHPRHFLAGLAFKYFHSTQYIRHHSKPAYTPEPDLCHELIGHVPMLADPACSDLIQAIGQASLAATTEAQIWHLTKIYWYTVEFGVVREGGAIKAFGAGILSSYGELAHMAAGGAALEEFDPFKPQPRMSYKDGYQQRYFVLGSFEEGAEKLRRYTATLKLPEELQGDASVA